MSGNRITTQLKSRGFMVFLIIALVVGVLKFGLPLLPYNARLEAWLEETPSTDAGSRYAVQADGRLAPTTPLVDEDGQPIPATWEAQKCLKCHPRR